MNELTEKIISEVKKYWFIPLLLLAGILFMTQKFDDRSEVLPVSAAAIDQEFIKDAENRVSEMLNKIEGAGECTVTITLASSSKKEYVRQDGNVLVIRDKDGNESAVVSKERAPEIAGVTVISTGAGSASVQMNIIESVSTVLGIGSNKVCVISKGGQNEN